MQRIWRSKPSHELIKIFEESVDLRLYLVHEKGPLSFTFQDEKSKKYFINIGDKITCNCAGNKKDQKEHCVHTIYVLNKIFKISFTDQLILQLQYSDSEINKMLESRKKNQKIIDSDSDNENKTSRKNKKKNNYSDVDLDEKRMNLIDDSTCSICQEDMYHSEGLFYCDESCGHNFHLNCLKIWAGHKKANGDNLTCPMCRQKWNDDFLKKQIVKNMVNKNASLKSHRNITCSNCSRKNIKGERFHCLICEDLNLCIECFNLNIHKNHHKNSYEKNNKRSFFNINILENSLILKKTPEENWVGFERLLTQDENNLKYNTKSLKFSQYLISLFKDSEKNKEKNYHNSNITENILENKNEDEEVSQINTNEMNLENSTEINEEGKEENNVPRDSKNDSSCVVCKSNRSSSLQLLKFKQFPICGHIIHVKCVELTFKISIDKTGGFRVDESFNLCRLDNIPIFPGLKSLKFNVSKSEENNNANNTNPNPNHNNFHLENNNMKIERKLSLNINQKNNKIIKEQDLFENAMMINSTGIKAPLSGGGKLGKLAPLNLVNKRRLLQNKDSQGNNPLIGLAINIQKVNFDEDNKIQNFEKFQHEKLPENQTSSKSLGKYFQTRKVLTTVGRVQEKSSERKLIPFNYNGNNIKEFSLPDLKVINTKFNNVDFQPNDLETLNRINKFKNEINHTTVNKTKRSIKTINHNNLGIKMSPLLNNFGIN